MRIVFITGSLEQGRDGVGDYTRRLACETIRQGHSCIVVAMNDSYISETRFEIQETEGVSLSVLRLPSAVPWQKRLDETRNWLNDYDPDWISLQFVPFGFHRKGLCFGLGKRLAALNSNASWHIMFHELWVGMEIGASLKLRWLGRLQRRIINLIIKDLKPEFIHTQTDLYMSQLRKMGHCPMHLPLFGNIPVITANKTRSLSRNQSELRFVVFGSIYRGAPIEEFIREVVQYKNKQRLAAKIVFIGRSGTELQKWVDLCGINNLPVEVLGEMPPGSVSKALSDADFGISTTPGLFAEKSGSIAAMLEHGLPVICLRQLRVRGFEKRAATATFLEYEVGNMEKLLQIVKLVDRQVGLKEIARKFLTDLSLPVSEACEAGGDGRSAVSANAKSRVWRKS